LSGICQVPSRSKGAPRGNRSRTVRGGFSTIRSIGSGFKPSGNVRGSHAERGSGSTSSLTRGVSSTHVGT
jgi:hypothetical protein